MLIFLILLVFLVLCSFISGAFADHYLPIRQWGLGKLELSYAPLPIDHTNQTLAKVDQFMKSDKTRRFKYEGGFNCVDFTWSVTRNAEWHGILSVAVTIYYEDLTAHMAAGFPTCDYGFVLYEPQSGKRIFARVGRVHEGRKVTGIYAVKLNRENIPLDGSPLLQHLALPLSLNLNSKPGS